MGVLNRSMKNAMRRDKVKRNTKAILDGTLFYRTALFNEAPPVHSAFRKTFIRPFTPAAVDKLERKIRDVATDMCDD